MIDSSTMTDQSIQVDFPIVVRNAMIAKRLRKIHTTEAFNLPNRSLQNSWVQLRPTLTRPKSLNLTTEAFQKSKITFLSESPINRNNNNYNIANSTISLQNLPREKSQPMGSEDSNSTLVLSQFKSYPNKISGSGTHTPTSPPPTKPLPPPQYLTVNHNNNNTVDTSLESVTSMASCRCLCEDEYSSNQRFATGSTPEGLSWRRLHMSRAKLKATATTSELLSGFAMVAMVELQINEPTNVPEWLFVMFAVCTTVLVSVHIFALMISTYILPNIDAISKLDVCELVAESPHERMRGFIELAWAFSTVLGLFLFLVEVAILCWVKFWDYSFNAAIAATVVVIPVLVIFVLFVVHFYHSLVVYRCDTSTTDMEKLEDMRKQLDSAHNPV